ncbi:ATPase [Pilimelia columellifera]|uniref:MinD-like ATPase involved in chromosome partitioning or flagellar assembly n=1 Tax=Pilimelia columellifera subsp. columellifera TaxID=706583 RepID=A0ABP6AJN6_9ACTN
MEGTDTGRDRPAPPAARWRALLDRARQRGSEASPDPGDDLSWLAPDANWPQPDSAPGRAAGRVAPSPPRLFEPVLFEPPPAAPFDPASEEPTDQLPTPPPPLDAPKPIRTMSARSMPPASTQLLPLISAAPPRAPAPPPRAPVPLLAGYGGQVEWRKAAQASDDPAVVLRRGFGRPRVVAFANPKGGVHKTTATVLAAATVGAVRGRGVIAWDDNELRGTLGLRAGTARHARTIRHLLADLAAVERLQGIELREQLDAYLRHAADASYDILAGEEDPRFATRLDAETVQRVLDLLRRTHEVVCVDTGNNVQSPNWQTVLRECDQLVITTVPREDAAFAADWMIDLLHDVGLGELAAGAVTLISEASPTRSPLHDDLERHFAARTRAVVSAPYDPALESGSSIDLPMLADATRRRWLRVAATIMAPFVDS